MINYNIDDIKEYFELIDDWEEKYKFIIDIGRKIPGLNEQQYVESNKVEGCASNVWMVNESNNGLLYFNADSDSDIVKGLIGILVIVFYGKKFDDAKKIDIDSLFKELSLDEHITPNRRNGFYSMFKRIKSYYQDTP